jgi:primosomal protein N' (replication factor Y) (superfamily II helicase)
VLHSGLTDLERAQQWWRVRRGDVSVVIGSRSAVFAPIARLGVICLDEEGSTAYKQDRVPRYDAVWAARRLAEQTGARLVLGSATPSLNSYSDTVAGSLARADLTQRVQGGAADVELVDLRAERQQGGRLPLSENLLSAIDDSLRAGEQAILFLNRRGGATYLLCRACGVAVGCPGCSVSLVQHPELGGIACHYCGYVQAIPSRCPACGSEDIRALGMGTQRLEGIVRKLWPTAGVARLDRDALKQPDSYWQILESFARHQSDILIGTQMAARGLDLESVTTVGVVDADLPLRFPDYQAAERVFSLVTQATGRAGGTRRSRVIVQTYDPDHHSLRAARDGDYQGFYQEEMMIRQTFRFPPTVELAVLAYRHADPDRAASAAREAAESLAAALVRERVQGVQVQGPSPAFIHRLRGEHYWQITVKGTDLSRVRRHLPRGKGWSFDVDPVN